MNLDSVSFPNVDVSIAWRLRKRLARYGGSRRSLYVFRYFVGRCIWVGNE